MNIVILVFAIVTFVLSMIIISLLAISTHRYRASNKKNVLNKFKIFGKNKNTNYQTELKIFAKSLINALSILGSEKIGALIVLTQHDDLKPYEKNGYSIHGLFSPEFTMSIFSNKKSALHDGAMIIDENFNIAAVSAYLPMTKNIIDVKYGARHRAAIGMSEATDALVFVVSETTGLVSYAKNGRLTTLTKDNKLLRDTVYDLLGVEPLNKGH